MQIPANFLTFSLDTNKVTDAVGCVCVCMHTYVHTYLDNLCHRVYIALIKML